MHRQKKSGKLIVFINYFHMSEQFQPEIKKADDVSRIEETLNSRKIAQHDREAFLNNVIGSGKSGTIVTREGKNDLWIRKEKGGVLK